MELRRVDSDKWVNIARVISVVPAHIDQPSWAKTDIHIDDGANKVGIVSSTWGPGKVWQSLAREDG